MDAGNFSDLGGGTRPEKDGGCRQDEPDDNARATRQEEPEEGRADGDREHRPERPGLALVELPDALDRGRGGHAGAARELDADVVGASLTAAGGAGGPRFELKFPAAIAADDVRHCRKVYRITTA